MKIDRFEDIIALQKAKFLSVRVYTIFNPDYALDNLNGKSKTLE